MGRRLRNHSLTRPGKYTIRTITPPRLALSRRFAGEPIHSQAPTRRLQGQNPNGNREGRRESEQDARAWGEWLQQLRGLRTSAGQRRVLHAPRRRHSSKVLLHGSGHRKRRRLDPVLAVPEMLYPDRPGFRPEEVDVVFRRHMWVPPLPPARLSRMQQPSDVPLPGIVR